MAGWYVLLAVSVAINVASALIRRDARRMQAEIEVGLERLGAHVDALRAISAAQEWAEQWLPFLERTGRHDGEAWRRDVQPLISKVAKHAERTLAEDDKRCSMN